MSGMRLSQRGGRDRVHPKTGAAILSHWRFCAASASAASVRKVKAACSSLEMMALYFYEVSPPANLLRFEGLPPLPFRVSPYRTWLTAGYFLTKDQIGQLLEKCGRKNNNGFVCIVKLCLSTGVRWSEAEELNKSQITKYKVTYTKTKGRKNRTILISEELHKSLPELKKGRLFKNCYGAFRSALERTDIELPAGQLTHVLRHTFASHFMMNGGNILVLQRVLGHTDIKMTMRYAHFAPNHFDEALKFNPLSNSL
ncbi:integrase family protein [Rahnella aceris]|uniref:Integrase family protein n=1 Tax=Rahnella sp. (strain Y9602) TaxID=2703885 RepID=A0A0H3F5W0_RAHSY|nr:integrase family protein [Rahnella aceris]